MALDIWKACNREKSIIPVNEVAWRIVELQEKTATRKLVDSIEEQKILEELIEGSKPTLLDSQVIFHRLLSTPFRYPSLPNGSRFGKKTEPSLWYGSLNPETAMAEKAYYQLAFINASAANFGMIISFMTIFSVNINISKGVKLDEPPFLEYKNKISSPTTYEASQYLGKQMRENSIDGFTFVSARDIKKGINIGLFKINSFAAKYPNPTSFETWQCNTTKKTVEFIEIGSLNDRAFNFPIQQFLVDKVFPFPSL